MSDQRLRWMMTHHPGAVEALLSRSFGGSRTPYDWLDRSVAAASTSVLVVVCGTGGMVERVKKDGRFVVGVDWSANSIGMARREGRGELVQADANYLPFADASFDAVVSDLGLAVNENRDLMLAEVERVLRPGGMFAGLTPSHRPLNFSDMRTLSQLARWLRVAPQLPGSTEFRAKSALKEAGLTPAEDSRARFYFDVRSAEDAELLVAALRADIEPEQSKRAVEQLTARAAEAPVRVPIPMRRLLALK